MSTSVYIIEKDTNNDLFTWGFTRDAKTVKILEARCGLNDTDIETGFFCSKFGEEWQYYLTTPIENEDNLCQIKAVSIVILSKQYNIAKYQSLLAVFYEHYLASYNTETHVYSHQSILSSYLATSASGKTRSPDGTKWSEEAYDPRVSLIAPVQSLLSSITIEAILIWVAVLMKKRIFVHAKTREEVMNITRSIAVFGGWHRSTTVSTLRPNINLTETDLQDVAMLSSYIAGTTDPKIHEKQNLYDILVDIPNQKVNINPAVKSTFQLGKYHKSVIDTILGAYEQLKEETNPTVVSQNLIKVIAAKTKELLDQLKACVAESGSVTVDTLTAMGVPAGMHAFMIDVANAEGINKA